jgi:hypothetical protein
MCHQSSAPIERAYEPLEIGTALEAIGRLRPKPQSFRGTADTLWLEIGALEQNPGARLADFAVLGAHDAGDADRAVRVGDDQHVGVESTNDAIQCHARLCRSCHTDDDAALV